MTHVIKLVAKSILKLLNPSSFANTEIACATANGKITTEIRTMSVVDRVRLLAIYLKSSPQRKQAWEALCKEHNLPQTVLQYNVETRWNSTYKMLQSSIKLKEQMKLYLDETKILPAFIDHDWHRIEQVCSVLRWLDSATETVSRKGSGAFCTLSLYYFLQNQLRPAVARIGEYKNLDHDISEAVAAGLKKCERYYILADSRDIYYVALFLDPRDKGHSLNVELDKEN
ncbi:ribonuclease H-like domain-containing protein, partial [Lipomyces japonicus]|uniref:ribonuclease H-like domain-containing protein n=1 Tax=Lipomyces japonicus TaxID=56871 RepID=UPI0034CD2C00